MCLVRRVRRGIFKGTTNLQEHEDRVYPELNLKYWSLPWPTRHKSRITNARSAFSSCQAVPRSDGWHLPSRERDRFSEHSARKILIPS